MNDPGAAKSTVPEIRARFDADVERFSDLEQGQTATMDAALSLELIAEAAVRCTPEARSLLDIGSGAGNYSLKMLGLLPGLRITLVDLSRPMLDRACQRLVAAGAAPPIAIQGDIREIQIAPDSHDIALAGAVLHHLRGEEEWHSVIRKVHAALRPGGSFWIADLVAHDNPAIESLMQERYAAYLVALGGAGYQRMVFDYIAMEDTPRSVEFQMQGLRAAGFHHREILHKNACFAAFGGMR